jgi:hypothetical protein
MSRSSLFRQAWNFKVAASLLVGFLAVHAVSAQTVPTACGPLANGYGPFDYRTDRTGTTLSIVEDNHFTPAVEQLISGITGSLGAELDYTLRAFPNHHRALLSLVRLGKRLKSPQPPARTIQSTATLSGPCGFDPTTRRYA